MKIKILLSRTAVSLCLSVLVGGWFLVNHFAEAQMQAVNNEAMDSSAAAAKAKPAEKKNPPAVQELNLVRGDLETIKTSALTRVSVTNPDIADIANADSNQILLLAKKAGQTSFFIWDSQGKRTLLVRVFDEDLNDLYLRLRHLLDMSGLNKVALEVNPHEGKVIASGSIPREKQPALKNLLDSYGNNVINLVADQVINDLVQIDVQIAELNSTYTKNLGLDWTSAVTYAEDAGSFAASSGRDIFKVGKLSRTTAITSVVNALIREGKGRVLSKPKLVVISGKEASFLVGGQVPISTTNTTTGGNVQQNVQFKDFGITLTITPTINDGKVNVVLRVEVSDLDPANASGNNPAFTTRNAQTQLLLEDGQTMVLAGLMKQAKSETVKKVPFLGDIPIIGLAFRNRSNATPDQETELVISLTPTIIYQRDKMVERKADELATKPESPAVSNIAAGNAGARGEEKKTGGSTGQVQSPGKQEVFVKPAAASVSAPYTVYIQSVQRKISEAIAYPYEAKEKGWEGTVKLALHILRDGTLADASVKESSGFDVFDKDALNTAQILAPYDPFPADLKLDEMIITVPIVYSQKEISAASREISGSKNAKPQAAISDYSELVQQKIAQAVIFPEEAKENGWQGTVKLALHILRDGTLADASVKESSGYPVFDECALRSAKSAAPYSSFPANSSLQEISLTVPIVYSFQDNAQGKQK